jgi:diaminopimelate decarboxylase
MTITTHADGLTPVLPHTFQIEEEAVYMGGVSLHALTKDYGTPLYVLDAQTIRTQAQHYRQTLIEHYPGEILVMFAAKANLNLAVAKLMQQEQIGLDVVSAGELYTAAQAGFPMEQVLFNGNNKSWEELAMALHHNVGRIVVDNLSELALLHDVAQSTGKKANIFLRVAPGIEAHTHDYLKTGHEDNKFGLHLSMLPTALDKLRDEYSQTLVLKGLHAHIGSQIFDPLPYLDLAEIILNIYYNIRQDYGWTLPDLDLGGGLGIAYTPQDDPPSVESMVSALAVKVSSYAQRLGYPLPRLLLEPGRSLVATAGITLYTVGSIKAIPNGRTFVAVDGGMGDNIRPALYQANYTALCVNKLHQPVTDTVTLVGKYCESGDVLLPQFKTPALSTGDIIVMLGTGAYNFTMASNYNRIPRPAMVLVEKGQAHAIVRRETLDDLLARDLLPADW